jgi:hypothetical protein
MSHGFLPRTDAGLLTWAQAFADTVATGPEQFGLSLQQADEFMQTFQAYTDALQVASSGATNSTSSRITKNQTRGALRTLAGKFNKIVQANQDVTDGQKSALGLTVARGRTATPTPESSPSIHVRSVVAHRVSVRLSQMHSESRGRPARTTGAMILAFLGEQPPSDLNDWTMIKLVTTTLFTLDFPASLAPGTQVWLTARWISNRLALGPASSPICTHLQGGGVQHNETMRLAA